MAGKTFAKYNVLWRIRTTPLEVEMECIRHGGQWKAPDGSLRGMGLLYHYTEMQRLLWPEKDHHDWSKLLLKSFIENRIIGVMGPGSSGKSHESGLYCLCTYYCFPNETTVLCCSTEREMLEMRVWGEIKKYHRMAKEGYPSLPGQLIEGRQRIVTGSENEATEGRSFTNGMVGVPCKRGEVTVGLGSFCGIKNKRVILLADEASLMRPVYVDAIANLGKNPIFKAIVLGNPLSTTDGLGQVCAPHSSLGGWDSGLDQTGGTKTWQTRFPGGICVQLVGSDSPNMKVPADQPPPYPYLITRKQMEDDAAFYTRDSIQFTSMNEGRMPRGEGSKRVLTRAICEQFHAMDEPVWKQPPELRIGFLDAAYGGVGGDRCVFGEMHCGTGLVLEPDGKRSVEKQIVALVDLIVVPVSVKNEGTPEDQIVDFVMGQCASRQIAAPNFFYDAGMKTSLVMAFSRRWSSQTVSIDFGGMPSERHVDSTLMISDHGRMRPKTCREHYSKFVTELWYSVRYAVEANQFRGMREDVLEEFCNREWGMVSGNKIEVEPKAKMKKRMGRSPDLSDGVAIAVEGARQRGFAIARLGSSARFDKDTSWLLEIEARERSSRYKRELSYA